MVAGMSMLVMGLLLVDVAAVVGVGVVIRGSHPTTVVLPALGLMISSLGALEVEWDQMNAG